MNFFSKIFGKSSTSETSIEEPQIEKSLFVDESEPTTSVSPSSEISNLERLQKKDFFHEGFVQGYEEHSLDILELRINSIISEFQDAICSEIDGLETSMQEIGTFLTKQHEEIMPDYYLKLRSTYDSMNLKKVEFNAEIELASDRKGACKHAINRFKEGFVRGLKAWSEETHFKA